MPTVDLNGILLTYTLPMDMTRIAGFDWDSGNAKKNAKHAVIPREIEEVFSNIPLLIADDQNHSQIERRYAAYGVTNEARKLAIVFTLRNEGTSIRPISARPMNRKERAIYEEAT